MYWQPFAINRTVEALDVGVLLRLVGLDIFEPNIAFLSPSHQFPTDPTLSAGSEWNCLRFAAPFDDLVQAAHNPFSGQREVDLDAQAFSIKVIQHIQCLDRSAIRQLVGNNIHRPRIIWLVWDRQWLRFVTLQAFLGIDVQVQL